MARPIATATLISALIFMLAHTGSAAAAEAKKPTETYNFNTSGDSKKDEKAPVMQFNTGEGTAQPTPVAPPRSDYEPIPEDAPFKTYLGYPKHRFNISVLPQNDSATWSYQGQDFSFSSSSMGYELGYSFLATPQWTFDLVFSRVEVSVDAATVTPYRILESKEDIDTTFFRATWCHIDQSSFLSRMCPGFELGYDAYPILDFNNSATDLSLNSVKDFVVGVNFAVMKPLIYNVLLTAKLGYNYGTGMGNSGTLTSKTNSSYYAHANLNLPFNDHHGVVGGVEYSMRQAEVSGLRGSIKDKWETNTAILVFRAGYNYTF